MFTNRSQHSSGQVLIAMLYVMVIGILVTTGAIYALIGNTQSTTMFEAGSLAYSAAESGAENALLRLVRNPAYAGELITITSDQSALITVSTSSGITIVSTGSYGTVQKQVEVKVHYNGGELITDSWRELPED
ncbi:hypothetical protein HZB58_01200 [Candidatus Gottesmanbacteria bacterium]|nr:hypothetical protein [Candidatus Gottesmanbacteria bacterium]